MSVVRARRNARHAKPSKAAPAMIAAGMTASFAVADVAAFAASASAATAEDFARLRGCESGNNYAINTHNGFSGAYQFDAGTWRGLGYSGLAYQASPATQDEAARRLQAQRGFAPWPSCSRQLGLGYNGHSGGAAAPAQAAPAQAAPAQQAAPAVDPVAEVVVLARNEPERASRSRRQPALTATAVTRIRVIAAPAAPPAFGKVLSVADGSAYRSDVAQWQQRMVARGWDLRVDGRFGPQTAAVAKRFAAEKHLAPTGLSGEVDAVVWRAAWVLPVS